MRKNITPSTKPPLRHGVGNKSFTGNIAVSTELCQKCGGCVAVCPSDAIVLNKGEFPLINEKCTRCGRCINICPVGVLFT